jgi:hypothetical protein
MDITTYRKLTVFPFLIQSTRSYPSQTACNANCSDYPGQNLENDYSFHCILSDDINISNSIAIDLLGNDDASSPLWRTGWTGILGNNALDKSIIKRFRFELNIDSLGDLMSFVTGSINLSNMNAITEEKSSTEQGATNATSSICKSDPSLRIRLDPLNPVPFRRVDFITRQCSEWYDRDSSCLFSFSDE